MENALYRALVNEARMEKLTDLGPVSAEGTDQKMPVGDRRTRGHLRLLIKAVVDSRLASNYQVEYRNDLQRVPWARNRELANRASNRFHEIAEWDARESGEEAASSWSSAARLAEILMEDYSGMPGERYDEVSSLYLNAVRGAWSEPVFRELLKALEKG